MRVAFLHSMVLAGGVAVSITFAPPGAGSAQQPGSQSDEFTWSSPAAAGGHVRIRNLRGDVSVEPTAGNRVEVRALKLWRRGNPAIARVEAHREGNDIVICVMWSASSDCDAPVSAAQSRAVGDVTIQLAIKVPAGMGVAANTINGDVSVRSDSRVVSAEAVNGNVVVRSREGSVTATTVNGSVTAYLVEPVRAIVDLQASGRLRSEFPIQVTHALKPGRIQGLIGGGGRKVQLRAMRGDINLRSAGPG